MSLFEHIDVCTPLVWVISDEPHRVTEVVAERTKRIVYRLDPLRGLLEFKPAGAEDPPATWRAVKVEVDDGDDGVREVLCRDPQLAMMKVIDERGILIMEHAHLNAKDMAPFYGAMAQVYLDAMRDDDADSVPAQFILISCNDEVPPEIRRQTHKVTLGLPDAEALGHIANRIVHGTGEDHEALIKSSVRAGQGLSELEFVNALLRSVSVKGDLEPDFINHIKVETIREGGLMEVRPPTLTIDDIGGLDRMKELISWTAWTWAHPEEAAALDVEPLRRFLLVGVPGSGKSAICEATANALGLDLARTGITHTMSKWMGESEQNMRKVFEQIAAMQPITLWMDEFGRDLAGGGAGGDLDSGTTQRVHGNFLTGLQELPREVILMAAANRIDGLPPEMTRADRFDKIVFVGLPTERERQDIFRIHLGRRVDDYNIEDLARATPEFTGAEIKALVKETRYRAAASRQETPTTQDMLDFAPQMKGRVWVNHHPAIIEMYKRALEEWDWASSEQELEAHNIIASKPQTPAKHSHRPTAPAVVKSVSGADL